MIEFFTHLTAIDFSILDFIQTHMRSPLLNTIMPYITYLGESGILWIILTIALLCAKKYQRDGFAVAAALILCLIFCNFLLKNIVARTRPFDIITTVGLLIKPPTDFSFPSGHTSAAFAAATALLLCKNKLPGIPALVLAVLIAFSRLYLYVHFPSDVLGGIVLGVAVAFAGYAIVDLIYKKIGKRKRGDGYESGDNKL